MIGFFDSGYGGLTVFQAAAEAFPDHDLVYLGDHANAPYGEKSPREITRLTRAGSQALLDLGCDVVILACNTAATTALRRMQHEGIHGVLGIAVPTIEAITGQDWSDRYSLTPITPATVGLFATPGTVGSGYYGAEILLRAPDIRLMVQPCPGLAGMIETGASEAEMDAAIAGFCAGLLAQGTPDRVVLGCTHYPLVADLFARHLPEGIPIIDQPGETVRRLTPYLTRHNITPGSGKRLFLTSGDPAEARRGTERLLGEVLPFEALEPKPITVHL
ncbi:glutamate racemase [Paracoccaceae bacterium GXU_MW_L88]